MTKISVLMPVYNTPENYLREAVESILAQTCADFEFLILNDASTDDNVEKVINSYDDKRIRYWQNDRNLGISLSRNKLIGLSRGEYLAVFDHDDVSLPERLEKQAAFLDAHPEVGVVGCWYRILGTENKVSRFPAEDAEIKEIRDNIPKDLEIETFIHGAMCISYSGRCLLSNYFTGRDANQGACTHPCRWKYAVVEEKRPGEYLPVYENERGTYIFNSKDLCMIEHIPELIDAGIDSFKIEGRMKTALYVATVARTYRKAIDDYLESPELYKKNMDWYKEQISNCTYRQFTTGFFFGKPDETTQIYDSNTYVKEYTYLGIVGSADAHGRYRIEQRNKFSVGEEIEVMKPNGENRTVTVQAIVDEEGNPMESAPHPQQVLFIDLGEPLECYDILRRKEEE